MILLFAVSCQTTPKSSETLAAANQAALEQTVDMENQEIEKDGVLQFSQAVLDLGEIPLDESRETIIEAINGSEKPLVLLDAYTSCHCTKIEWDKKPIPSGGKVFFKVRFTAEEPGVFFKKIGVRHNANTRPVTFAIKGVVTSDPSYELRKEKR